MVELIKKIFNILSEYYPLLFKGLLNTLIIALCSFIIGIVVGCIVAIVEIIPAKRNVFIYALKGIAKAYVTVVRGTPVVVQLLLMYFAILAPTKLPALVVAIIVFGLNSGAYMSEIMRAGILSIDKGQMEAGRTLGLSYSTTMTKIILPQAVKNSLPAVVNELIALLKETSVAGYITVLDVTTATQRIVANEYTALAPYLTLAVVYLLIVGILTIFMKFIERKLRKSDNSI